MAGNPTSQACLDHHCCEKNVNGAFVLAFHIILIKLTIKAQLNIPVTINLVVLLLPSHFTIKNTHTKVVSKVALLCVQICWANKVQM